MSQQQPDVGRMMAEALRAQMPSLKTQAQFTAFMISFDTFRHLMDAIFSGDKQREEKAREAFDKSLEAAKSVTDLGNKFQEVPPEHRSKASEAFTAPPAEFHEYDVQKKLLLELEGLNTLEALNDWYQKTRGERDRVVSQPLRNALIDSIRSKRLALEPTPTEAKES